MAENSKKIGSFQPFNRTIGARCNYPQEELGNEWLLKKTNHLQTWNILHFERTAIISSYFSYMRILYYIYLYISKLIFWTYEPFPLFAPLKVCCWHISTKNCLLKTCANQKKKTNRPLPSPKEKHPGGLTTVTSDAPGGFFGRKARNQSGENRKSGRDEFMVTVPRNFSKWWRMEVVRDDGWDVVGWLGWLLWLLRHDYSLVHFLWIQTLMVRKMMFISQ